MTDKYASHFNIVEYNANLSELALSFDCGNYYINQFLKSGNALDPGFGKTYVWLDEDRTTIIGYYNIAAGCIIETTSDDSYKMGGAVHINEFAIDLHFQDKTYDDNNSIYLSDILLSDCINRVEFIRGKFLGVAFITLCSTQEGYKFYKRNQFDDIEEEMKIPKIESKEDDCIPLYYALDLEI